MNISLDKTLTQRIVCAKSQERFFTFEFPSNAAIHELFGVVSELKSALWKTIEDEEKNKKKEQETEVPTTEAIQAVDNQPDIKKHAEEMEKVAKNTIAR